MEWMPWTKGMTDKERGRLISLINDAFSQIEGPTAYFIGQPPQAHGVARSDFSHMPVPEPPPPLPFDVIYVRHALDLVEGLRRRGIPVEVSEKETVWPLFGMTVEIDPWLPKNLAYLVKKNDKPGEGGSEIVGVLNLGDDDGDS